MMFHLPKIDRNNIYPNSAMKRLSQSGISANQFVTSAKCVRVTFSDTVDDIAVTPYSAIYGWLPTTRVATCDGWKLSAKTYATSQENSET